LEKNCHTISGFERVEAAVLVLLVVLPCGACRQAWTFARHDQPATSNYLAGTTPAPIASQPVPTGDTRQPEQPPASIPGGAAVPGAAAAAAIGPAGQNGVQPVGAASYRGPGEPGPQQPSPLAGTSFETASGDWAAMAAEAIPSNPAFQPPGGLGCDWLPQAAPEASLASCEPNSRLGRMWQQAKCNIWTDHTYYYSWTTFRDLALGLAIAAPVANTNVDEHFRDWYRREVRSPGTDKLSTFWKPFGNGYIVAPGFVGLALVGRYFENVPVFGPTGDFSGRVTRGYLVGTPPMLLLQYALGASRPEVSSIGSHWRPFHANHSVSGHAFMGAVPFLTAAGMVENPWAKGTLYALSTFPAWSRFNDGDHYLSQVWLGWWMGYLACNAVRATQQQEDKQLTLTPIATPEMVGMGMVYRR
jgi:hypothetical protein